MAPTITALVVASPLSAGERTRAERGQGDERSVGTGFEEHGALCDVLTRRDLGTREEACNMRRRWVSS